ncbi:MAG: S-layer protein, partial [Fuerstiella sp.]|nr:S-layer protein [Fuerstiella sp.]
MMKISFVSSFLCCAIGTSYADTPLQIGPVDDTGIVQIRSRDTRQQLFVTHSADTSEIDVTRTAMFSVQPEGVLQIDGTGLVTPLADGEAVVKAQQGDHTVELKVVVSGFENPLPINFRNQVVPIFTKLGCNSGGCHGKASGQNGFKLSLLGFYPEDDFEFLRKESRGRRVFPGAPSESLLMTKATGRSPHGGGKRMDHDSYEYRMLIGWIEQGMPYGSPDNPYVTSIQCFPEARVMPQSSEQQISVIATYSDGTTEDVTRMALYEANDTEMAECSKSGLVSTLDLAGEVAIMARYQG